MELRDRHAQKHNDADRDEKTREGGVSPASTTDIAVRTHRREDRSGVSWMRNLGFSGKRARA